MSVGKVLSIKPTQDGKGKWFEVQDDNGKHSFLAKIDTSALKEGSVADFNVKRNTSQAGKTYYTLESFRFDGGATISQATTPVTKGGLSEPELRFVSNVVGQALLAKTITDPEQIRMWVLAAQKAINQEA